MLAGIPAFLLWHSSHIFDFSRRDGVKKKLGAGSLQWPVRLQTSQAINSAARDGASPAQGRRKGKRNCSIPLGNFCCYRRQAGHGLMCIDEDGQSGTETRIGGRWTALEAESGGCLVDMMAKYGVHSSSTGVAWRAVRIYALLVLGHAA